MYLSVWLYYFVSIINHELYFADSEATDSSSDDEIENKVSKFLVAGANSRWSQFSRNKMFLEVKFKFLFEIARIGEWVYVAVFR